MNCRECRGACCESFTAEIQMVPPHRDSQRWLELHATHIELHNRIDQPFTGKKLTFECRCVALTSDGQCSIWETRPMVCELFIAGSKDCLKTVKARRTPEDYQRIRGEDDPPTLERILS